MNQGFFPHTPIAWAAATAAFLLGQAAYAQNPSAQAAAQAKAAVQLSEVVVSAAGFEQAAADAPATISVITAQDLQGKFYRDVTDALQDIPGLSIEGGGGGKIESTSVTIRGMGEAYVLFLVDGRPVGDSSEAYYNGFGGAAHINMLPPVSSIERIEVIRGPMSSLYGSSALGGVINIITRKNQPSWKGQVTLDTTQQQDSRSGDIWQANYHFSGPIAGDALSLAIWGNQYHRAEDRIAGGYAFKTRSSTNARLAWKVSDAQSVQIEAGFTRNNNRRTALSGGDRNSGDMRNRRPHFALTHDIRWRPGLSTRSFVTHEKVSIQNGGNRSSYQALVANSKTVWGLGAHTITLGADFKKEQTNHMAARFPGSKKTNLSRWQAALFAEDEWALTQELALTGGLRVDRNEHYGTEVTPRLYAVYKLGNDQRWALKGGVSGGYKTPSLKQADANIVEVAARGRAWDKGNTALKPERSTNYEIGTTWTGHGRSSFSATYYQTRFKDKISTQRICNSARPNVPTCEYNGERRQWINEYINLDSARLSGLEVAASTPVGSSVLLKTSYTYSQSEITSGANRGKPLNNLPRHMLNVGVDWAASDAWQLWAKAKYKGKTLEDGKDQRPAYTLVDVGAHYTFNANVKIFGGIYNLFDRQINSADNGKTLDGRRLHLGVTAQF